jgi:hypothetical protein
MSTLAPNAPAVKRARTPRKGSPKPDAAVSLSLWIGCHRGRQHYRVIPVHAQDPAIRSAWTLIKGDGEAHTVHVDGHGPACTCGSFVYRKAGTGEGCKHINALATVGLIAPTPATAPAPAPVDRDGLPIETHTPDGRAWDQDGAGIPSDLIEPPAVDRPDPRPADLDDARPWWETAPRSALLDSPIGLAGSMRVTAEEEARMHGGC